MSSTPTAERILDAARTLFNERSYAEVTLTEIAASIGISQGNLTYHFPTKRILATTLRDRTRLELRERSERFVPGDVVADYVEHLRHSMAATWANRFLLMDTSLLFDEGEVDQPPPGLVANFAELRELLVRMIADGLFVRVDRIDVERLTRSLWIVSRYWMDHLREIEQRHEITWDDQLEGIHHHLALLRPHLTAAAQRRFEQVVADASLEHHEAAANGTDASAPSPT